MEKELLDILGLHDGFTEAELNLAYERKKQGLQERLEKAPDALKQKFLDNLDQLDSAYQSAKKSLSRSMQVDVKDLPVAEKYINTTSRSGLLGEIEDRFGRIESCGKLQGFDCFWTQNKEQLLKVYEGELAKPAQTRIEKQLGQLQSLKHKYVEEILEYHVGDKGVWIAFEGGDYPSLGGSLHNYSDPDRLVRLLRHINEALEYLSLDSGHGGLSPESIFVRPDGTLLIRNIFINSLFGPESYRTVYTAPEIKRAGSGSNRSDQYSLAVLALEVLLDGRLPAGGIAAGLADNRLSESVKSCLSKATHETPSQRFASIEQFCQELDLCFESFFEKIKKKPLVLAFIGFTVLLLILGGVFYKQLFGVYEQNMTALANGIDYELESVRRVAEAKEMVVLMVNTGVLLDRELEKARSYLQRLERGGRGSKQDLEQASIDFAMAEIKRNFYRDSVMTEATLTDIKSSLAVAGQIMGAKDYRKAYEYITPVNEKLALAKDAIDSLDEFVEIQHDVDNARETLEKLEPSVTSDAAFKKEEQTYLDKIKQLNSDGEFAQALQDGYRPLLSFYETRVSNARDKARSLAQSALQDFLSKVAKDMKTIPAGKYEMGIVKAGMTDARPAHDVSIASFKMGAHPVTNSIMRSYAKLSGNMPSSRFPDNTLPATDVSWLEASTFANWLADKSGVSYRLPTESEWEYAARAGIKSTYPWGNSVGKNNANCETCGSKWDNSSPAPVGSFKPNQFGLFDLNGNVWEWTQDCYANNYENASPHGSAFEYKDCGYRVARGGAWNTPVKKMHPSVRSAAPEDTKSGSLGFRLAQSL